MARKIIGLVRDEGKLERLVILPTIQNLVLRLNRRIFLKVRLVEYRRNDRLAHVFILVVFLYDTEFFEVNAVSFHFVISNKILQI